MRVIINCLFVKFLKLLAPILLMLVLFLMYSCIAVCQSRIYPKIGDSIPRLLLRNVQHDGNKSISSADIKGKFVLLDFWSTGCIPCVEFWPVANKIQQKYEHQNLEVILVGLQQKNRDVRMFYDRFKNRYNLDLTVAYDSIAVRNYVPRMVVPHMIWIDSSGIVKAITTSEDATPENIERFLAGRDFPFTDRSFSGEQERSRLGGKLPPLSGGVAADSTNLFSSQLFRWKANTVDITGFTIKDNESLSQGEFQASKLDLKSMYHLAYFGSMDFSRERYYPMPVITTKDSIRFKTDYKGDGKELYNYIIKMPKGTETAEKVMKTMQRDLENCFNYKVRIVTRDMPCLTLVVVDAKKVEKIFKHKIEGRTQQYQELKYKQFVDYDIANFHTAFGEDLPWPIKYFTYNETKLTGKISVRLKGDLGDLKNLRKELNKNGLDLRPGRRPIDVLEISDPDKTVVNVE